MATMLDYEQHNAPSSATSNPINFEELFNMELFAGSQIDGTTSPSLSRAGSNSPSTSFLSLPPATPPTLLPPSSESFINNANLDAAAAAAMFDFALPESESDFTKPPTIPLHPTIHGLSMAMGLDLEDSPSNSTSPQSTASPYNFFGSFSPVTPPDVSRTADSQRLSSSLSPSKSIFAIDPSLVDVPSSFTEPQTSFNSLHSIDEEDDSEVSDDDHDAELDMDEPVAALPVKVGGKGKGRKGTVASGGVTKRSASGGSKASERERSIADGDWRPSPEEYKKMSSKEKRQLRNKISARNFRIRRKEYISTLEGDIADRDRLIEAIRSELGSTKLENDALRQEVEALKRAMLEGRANPDLPPPAPLPLAPAASANSAPTTTTTKRSSSRLSKPNTQKDLPPTSPRASAARAFWGGRGGNNVFGGAAGGGVTSVHATLVPDLFSQVKNDIQFHDQENINPALNLPCFGGFGVQNFGGAGASSGFAGGKLSGAGLGSNFDAFAETNPFTFKSLDSYRMQLWGRMAREAGQKQARASQQQQQQQQTPLPPPQGLASILRPAYFNTPSRESIKEKDYNNNTNQRYSSSLTALLSGKLMPASSFSSPTSFYPSPPSSPRLSPLPTSTTAQPDHAILASIASQTLFSKLGNAFWDAFARPSSSSASSSASASSSPARGDWDHDKVRRVLEGKAVVKIVDVDTTTTGEADSADALEASMKKLSIGRGAGSTSTSGSGSCSDTCACVLSRTKAAVIGKKT